MGLSKAKIVTVSSAKGGTGKSVFVCNLAGCACKKKIKTLIIDLDLSSGVIGASLNVKYDENVFTLAEDMMNNRMKNIENYIFKYNDYIDVVCAPNDPRDRGKIHFQYIENIIKQLSFKYELILIDTNHVMDEISSRAIDSSDYILYIITDGLMDLKNMKSLMAIYADLGINNYKIVLNEMHVRSYTDLEVKNILGTSIDYVLPNSYYDENFSKIVEGGKILSIVKPKNKGVSVIDRIIEDIK